METKTKIIIAVISAILILTTIFYVATPQGRALWNQRAYDIQKADDATNYETIKKVEDTCRAMIASYEADKLTYDQYKDSDNEEKQGWAEQAKMRANKTVSSYNNYIIKNTFVWKDNVPEDIYLELAVIE